ADLHHGCPVLRFPQGSEHLFLDLSTPSCHRRILLLVKKTTSRAGPSSFRYPTFRALGQIAIAEVVLPGWHNPRPGVGQVRLVLVVLEVCAGEYGAGRPRDLGARGEKSVVSQSAAGLLMSITDDTSPHPVETLCGFYLCISFTPPLLPS